MSRLNSRSFQYFIRETRQGQPTHFHGHFKARLLYYSISNLKSGKWFQIKNQFAGVLVGEIGFYIYVGVCEGGDPSFKFYLTNHLPYILWVIIDYSYIKVEVEERVSFCPICDFVENRENLESRECSKFRCSKMLNYWKHQTRFELHSK